MKLKKLSEQNGYSKEKVMEMQKLKLNSESQNKIQLQQQKLILDKMQLLKEYQLDKTKQDVILKQQMNDLLSAKSQNKILELQEKQLNDGQLNMLLEQKQLTLKQNNSDAQKLLF